MSGLNQLKTDQSQALIECFSMGFTMGLTHPIEHFVAAERFFTNTYIHPPDFKPESKLTALTQAMIVFLKQSFPEYANLKNKNDFYKAVSDFYNEDTPNE